MDSRMNWIDLYRGGNIVAGLLEAKRKPTSPGEEVYSYRSIFKN